MLNEQEMGFRFASELISVPSFGRGGKILYGIEWLLLSIERAAIYKTGLKIRIPSGSK